MRWSAHEGVLAEVLAAVPRWRSGIEAANAQEREALADPEYHTLLKGLAAAVEKEETLKWEIEAARLEVEIWRTQQATNRLVNRSHE